MAAAASESPNWTFIQDDPEGTPGDHVQVNCLVDIERDGDGYLRTSAVRIGKYTVRDQAVVEQIANLALDLLEVTESLPGAPSQIAVIPAQRAANPAAEGVQLTFDDIPLEPQHESPRAQVA